MGAGNSALRGSELGEELAYEEESSAEEEVCANVVEISGGKFIFIGVSDWQRWLGAVPEEGAPASRIHGRARPSELIPDAYDITLDQGVLVASVLSISELSEVLRLQDSGEFLPEFVREDEHVALQIIKFTVFNSEELRDDPLQGGSDSFTPAPKLACHADNDPGAEPDADRTRLPSFSAWWNILRGKQRPAADSGPPHTLLACPEDGGLEPASPEHAPASSAPRGSQILPADAGRPPAHAQQRDCAASPARAAHSGGPSQSPVHPLRAQFAGRQPLGGHTPRRERGLWELAQEGLESYAEGLKRAPDLVPETAGRAHAAASVHPAQISAHNAAHKTRRTLIGPFAEERPAEEEQLQEPAAAPETETTTSTVDDSVGHLYGAAIGGRVRKAQPEARAAHAEVGWPPGPTWADERENSPPDAAGAAPSVASPAERTGRAELGAGVRMVVAPVGVSTEWANHLDAFRDEEAPASPPSRAPRREADAADARRRQSAAAPPQSIPPQWSKFQLDSEDEAEGAAQEQRPVGDLNRRAWRTKPGSLETGGDASSQEALRGSSSQELKAGIGGAAPPTRRRQQPAAVAPRPTPTRGSALRKPVAPRGGGARRAANPSPPEDGGSPQPRESARPRAAATNKRLTADHTASPRSCLPTPTQERVKKPRRQSIVEPDVGLTVPRFAHRS